MQITKFHDHFATEPAQTKSNKKPPKNNRVIVSASWKLIINFVAIAETADFTQSQTLPVRSAIINGPVVDFACLPN
jgi:hypothetical protein